MAKKATEGYIALHRSLLDNPVVCKDADHLAIWVWLLLKAAWKESDVLFSGKRITLNPGDLPPISRRTIAKELNISDSKVQRVLKFFESEHQIEQRANRQSRLITIVSWDKYQGREPPSKPRVNHKRTTSEPRVNTIEEGNKVINNISSSLRSEDIYIAPTREEVQKYVDENDLCVDADYFFDYYESRKWHNKGGEPVRNWKLTAQTWHRREVRNGNHVGRSGGESYKPRGTPSGRGEQTERVRTGFIPMANGIPSEE